MNRKQITKLGAILYRYLDVSDWEEIFRLCDLEQYLYDHSRFIRSLKWDDPDAKGNCFDATDYLHSNNSLELYDYLRKAPRIMGVIKKEIPEVFSEIMQEEVIESIDVEKIASLNQILREAMDDAEILIENGKPANAYDRIYTSLHGVLEKKCEEQSIRVGNRDTVSSILAKIRIHIHDQEPKDKTTETAKVIASISKIIDILNEMRNKKSLAHPNRTLLENDEALFLINISKAIMRYINDIMG